jgi:hypothetical protein
MSDEGKRTYQTATPAEGDRSRAEAGMDAKTLRALLRDPYLDAATIAEVLADPELRRSYEVRRELSHHPKTPRVDALDLVPGLRWRDLAAAGTSIRVAPPVRHAADLELNKRVATLALGERIALARRASVAVIEELRRDREPRVIASLFENPRLTEGHVVRLATDRRTDPRVLLFVGQHPRWSAAYEVRLALCRNPKTPLQISVPALLRLRIGDRRGLARDATLPPVLQREARRSLEGGGSR